MKFESLLLIAILILFLAFDFVAFRGLAPRIFWLDVLGFAAGGFLIMFPELTNLVAHKVGLWPGVDFVIYPLVVWLFRESLMSRLGSYREGQRITQLARAFALKDAHSLSPEEPS